MNIERKQLIELCDKFLKDEIQKIDLSKFAFEIRKRVHYIVDFPLAFSVK